MKKLLEADLSRTGMNMSDTHKGIELGSMWSPLPVSPYNNEQPNAENNKNSYANSTNY